MDNLWDHLSDTIGYREIDNLGVKVGLHQVREETRLKAVPDLTLRLLQRRCGFLDSDQQIRIRALSRTQLGDLCRALLDFRGTADPAAWLATP